MKIYKTMRKRGLALFLALTMCLSLIQTTAFANEEAEHAHNEGGWTCAYTDPVTEPACAHEHDAACGYVEAAEEIPCVCTGTDEECGIVHEDGCAYAPAVEGAPCGHVCGDACVAVVTEGYWECTPPAGEPEDTEPTEDAEAPEEDAEVPEKDAETETPEEVPAEVQAFLDAVAAIPEITAENAAEVAEYVYGPVSEAYDALLGTEHEERPDVMEAVAVYVAALEAVDVAMGMESENFARNINVYNNTLEEVKNAFYPKLQYHWTDTVNKGTQSRVTLHIEETAEKAFVPVNGEQCPYCGYIFGGGYFAPTKYCQVSGSDSKEVVTTAFGKTNTYDSKVGNTDCLRMDINGQKPGTSSISVSFWCNFEMYILNSNVYGDTGSGKFACISCRNPIIANNDAAWHKYTYNVPVTVNADYVLNYDANGGSVSPRSQRQTKASTSCSFTLPTPTRDGYIFKGWAESKDAATGVIGTYTLDWSEGFGGVTNPVTKALYAVWEKDSEGSNHLTVTKNPSKEYPVVGEEFKYTIEVKNNSDAPAIVKVVDKLPEELDFVKVSQSDSGVYDKDTHTVTWESVTVPANGSKQLLVWVKANTAGKIENTATVHFGDETISGNTTVEAKSEKPEAPSHQDVRDLVGAAVKVICKPDRHSSNSTFGYSNEGQLDRITISEVTGDAESGYTCEVTFLAQKFCDAYNTTKTSSGVEHTLVKGESDKTLKLTWNADTKTWTRPADFKAPVTFYVECPNPEEPIQPTAKIEVQKTNDGFQTDPETGNAVVNYTVTVKNVSGFDLYGLKLTDELTPTLIATGEGDPTATYTFSNWKVKTTGSSAFEEIEPYQVKAAGKTHLLALLARNTEFKDQQTVTLTYTVEIKTNNAPAKIKLENTATAEYWTAKYTEPQTRAVRAAGNDPFPDPPDGSASGGSSVGGNTSGSTTEGTLPQKYTVTYEWNLPEGATPSKTLPTDTLESRPAKSHFTVDANNKQGDEVTGSDGKTYVFSGWKVPADIQTETEGQYEDQYVMPARDVTITGTWTAKEDKAPAFDPTLLQSVNVKVICSSDESHNTDNDWQSLYGRKDGDKWTPWGDEYYTIGSVEKVGGKYQCVVTLKPEKWAKMRIAEFMDDVAGHVFDETAKDAKTCVTFTYDPGTESWKSDLNTAVVFIRETLETRTVTIVKAFYGPTQEQVKAIKDDFSITYTYKLNDKTEIKTLNGKDAVLGKDTPGLFADKPVVMAWETNFTVNKGSTNDSGFGVISFVESGHHIDGFTWTGNGEGSGLDEQRLSAATISIGLSNHYVPEAPTEYTVTVRYVDTHGNTIRSDERVPTTNGGKYDVTAYQVTISGYRCQGADNPLTGTVAGNTTITLTYVKQITVTWVDENGSTVRGPITIDENAPYSNPEGLDENGHWGSPVADANGNITIQWVPGHPATRTVTWLSGYGTNRVLHTGEIPWDTTDVPARLYPSDPYRSGYTFRGWGAPVIGEDGNITITARWQMIPPVTPPSGGGSTGGTTIPDTQTPLDPGTTIADQDVPLAAPGLNNTDHFDYIKGYVIDGQILVRPEANITRAEVATIFFRLMTKEFREANWATENDFTDMKKGDWYNNAISTCTKAGILKGYEDGTFKPNQTISREEFAAIAARFASEEVPAGGMFKDIAGRWSEKDIERAAAMGWIKGSNGLFRPVDKITRAEVIVIVNRMLDRVPDADHMLPDMKTFADNTPDMWWYADVQEATNSHEYDRAEDGVTGIWTSLLPEQDWAALEEEWATAADANVADVAPKPGAEGEKPEEGAKEPETAGGSDGNGEE